MLKSQLKTIGLVFFSILLMISCKDNFDAVPTSVEFTALSQSALAAQTQKFTFTAGTGTITLTSAKGVKININSAHLTKGGLPVTGTVDITYVEIFDKGHMLVTNKPTMGIMPDGTHNLLKSGGEFYIKATQGGQELATTASITLLVPTALTGVLDNTMTFWTGVVDNDGELVWKNANDTPNTTGGRGVVQGEKNNYYVSFGNFGWTNVDRFYSDPRTKTTILVRPPEGYDNKNSAVYLSYDGEGKNALAKLDKFTSEGLFSEHYGQIPIGLACHIIFATEEDGKWKYAIKGVTVKANDIYTFTSSELITVTEEDLVAAINLIQ
jgi:hypothetical protein